MKQAQGFVTFDGTFFEKQEEALLHEAEMRLRQALISSAPEVKVERFMAVLFEVRNEAGEYINAYAAAYPPKPDQQAEVEDRAEIDDGLSAEAPASQGHISSAEEDLAALLKLPTRGPGHVPDVGSGSRTEKVQERRSEHGSRVRRTDASGVRSRKDMATKQSPET